jgi:sortase A
MVKYYKQGKKRIDKKNVLRIASLSIILSGICLALYVFFPVLSWQIYFAPAFANQEINAPIPKSTVVSRETLASLISEASQSISGVDFNNIDNWFPNYKYTKNQNNATKFYSISIPKINLENAVVSAVDTDLASHLVNYGGTAIAPEKGNAVIFGHSTLPQLYNPKNYKTTFTYLPTLSARNDKKPGDLIIINYDGIEYTYMIHDMYVTKPTDLTPLEQKYDDINLTLITCVPPGTYWERLIVKAKLVPPS